MYDNISAVNMFLNVFEIENVAAAGGEIGMFFESSAVQAVARVGVVYYNLIMIDQPGDESGTYKAGAPG